MATIEVDLAQYVHLLVKAGDSDPANWPEGLKEGATLLGRIRQIEQMGREEHGEWDWELISEEMQDEYDSCSALLDKLLRPLDPTPDRPTDDVFAEIEKARNGVLIKH